MYFYFTCTVLVCSYIGLKRLGYYENFGNRHAPSNYFSLMLTIVFAFCAPLFALFLIKASDNLSRVWFLTWMVSVYATLLTTRYLWNWLLDVCAEHGHFAQKVVLVGCSEPLERAKRFFSSQDRSKDFHLLSVYDLADVGNSGLTDEQLPAFQNLLKECRDHSVDEVIIALPGQSRDLLDRVIKTVKLLPAEVSLFSNYLEQNLKLYGVKNLDGMQTISVQRTPISDWGRFAKLVADYIISAAAVLALSPLMLLIALAIKLDSSGPVFFRQRRQGLNGKIIKVMKFRTMTVMEDGDTVKQAQKNDQRVTRVGRILRQSSLDELPQFFNVLSGEMSIVGPRPHAIAHNTYYESLLENYANRYRVKPGITGWAQVNGFRGEVHDQSQMENRVRLDLEYIDNWNFWFDMYIILVTPFFGLMSRNAY